MVIFHGYVKLPEGKFPMCFFPSFSIRPRGEVFWSTDWGRLLDASLRQGDPERFKTLGAAHGGEDVCWVSKSLEACKFIRLLSFP